MSLGLTSEMSTKKILVLGSGLVAKPCVDYLLRDEKNILTIGGSLCSFLCIIEY